MTDRVLIRRRYEARYAIDNYVLGRHVLDAEKALKRDLIETVRRGVQEEYGLIIQDDDVSISTEPGPFEDSVYHAEWVPSWRRGVLVVTDFHGVRLIVNSLFDLNDLRQPPYRVPLGPQDNVLYQGIDSATGRLVYATEPYQDARDYFDRVDG